MNFEKKNVNKYWTTKVSIFDTILMTIGKDNIVYNETRIETSTFFTHPSYSTLDRRDNDIARGILAIARTVYDIIRFIYKL